MTTSAAGSSSNSPRQSAASATSSRSSPPWRAMARSRSNGCTVPTYRASDQRSEVPAGCGRVGPNRGERPLQRGEQLGAPGEHLGASAHLERAPGEGVLGPQRALVQRPRGGDVGDQHHVGRRRARCRHRRTVGAEVHLVPGAAVGTVAPRVSTDEGEIGGQAVGGPGGGVERRDPRGGQEFGHTGGCYRRARLDSARARRLSLGSRPGELSCARDRGRRAREALRRHLRGGRDLLLDRDRRGLRPPRAERRGQDHDGRDPRGLPPRRRRRGARPRRRPVARRRRSCAPASA